MSDNASDDKTEDVVCAAQQHLEIQYHKNESNIGVARNILKVVEMADGEFVWLLGDDDLLMPDAIDKVIALIDKHKDVDYFYVNSNHLTTEYVLSFPQPFNTSLLPENMRPFSPKTDSSEMPFLNLIDHKVSFDFLGGVFLSVFRRE